MFRAVVNDCEENLIASGEDAETLCSRLNGMAAFTVHAMGPAGMRGPTLQVFVGSGRGVVSFLDLDGRIKLASRDRTCPERDTVWLRDDSYSELEWMNIEVERRDLISRERAVAILRRFLTSGEVADLVPWPPED
jgi:hypothetical protein